MATVHFVGSVGLDTPEEVFAAIGKYCGPYLKRVPDGEPGGRRLWISWQIPVLRANPLLAQVGEGQIPLKLADGARLEEIHFGELGYAREARPSYQDFLAAKSAGQIPANVRFQVSLPTPWAVIMPFCRQPDGQQVLPAYEQAMLREVARICKAIPHNDLAIQWDVCIEMLAWDGRWPTAPSFPGMEKVFAGTFARLGAAVPPDVELGFHLCYGDLDAKHMIEPIDATKMVELANLIARSVRRPITWMPPSIAPMTRSMRHSRICNSEPRPSCTSGWFTRGTASKARRDGSPSPRSTFRTLELPQSAASRAAATRTSRWTSSRRTAEQPQSSRGGRDLPRLVYCPVAFNLTSAGQLTITFNG